MVTYYISAGFYNLYIVVFRNYILYTSLFLNHIIYYEEEKKHNVYYKQFVFLAGMAPHIQQTRSIQYNCALL